MWLTWVHADWQRLQPCVWSLLLPPGKAPGQGAGKPVLTLKISADIQIL